MKYHTNRKEIIKLLINSKRHLTAKEVFLLLQNNNIDFEYNNLYKLFLRYFYMGWARPQSFSEKFKMPVDLRKEK